MSKTELRWRRARRLCAEQLESRLALTALFVSPLGSDSNPGTAAAPWQTLQKSANSVNPGDVVTVRAGNYVGFDLRRDGTSAAPISFLADPGVNITQRNAVTADGINLESADYITIDGFTVNSMPRAGIRSVTNQHVTIRNNHADLNATWGIFTGFSDDLLIENNVTSRSQTQHGIYVSNSGDRPILRGNISWGNAGAGIHMNGDISQGGDGIISSALVENNVIYDNGTLGGSGINCDGVQNSRIQNNLIYNNHASGISLYRIDGGGSSSSNVVVNNTIVQASDARWALNIQNASTSNLVLNNILYNNHSFRGSIDISSDSLPGLVSDYNVLMNRMTTNGGTTVLTLAQWQAATGQDSHSLVATPAQLFVNPGANDYHLSATSAAIDRGTSQSAPARDIEQNPRPSGAAWDIGAYERQTGTTNRAPVATDDAVQTAEDSPVDFNVLLNDSDPDGNSLTVASFTQPTSGVVSLVNGQLHYAPAANFNGQVSFTYQATDGSLLSNSATVVVSVSAVNDAPVNQVPGSQTVVQDQPLAFSTANGNAVRVSDVDGGSLQVTLSAGNGLLTLASTAGLSFSAGDGSGDASMTFSGQQSAINAALNGLRFNPTAGYVGSANLTVATNDQGNTGSGGPLSDSDSVAINVQASPPANQLTGFDVQHGASQRSFIRYVDLAFASGDGLAQLIAENRIRLTQRGLDGSGGAAVSLAGRARTSGNQLELDFGPQGIGGYRNSAKGNGYYTLSLDLDANGSFETVRNFYRLFGDANGDRQVESADLAAINAAFGTAGANLNADVNGDGVVDSQDRNAAKKQQGQMLASSLPIDD